MGCVPESVPEAACAPMWWNCGVYRRFLRGLWAAGQGSGSEEVDGWMPRTLDVGDLGILLSILQSLSMCRTLLD